MFLLLRIGLLGLLATIAAKIGISGFYEIFPPDSPRSLSNFQSVQAAVIGLIFASPFLYFLSKSVNPSKKKRILCRKPIRVNKESLVNKDPFFDVVKELKRK